MSLQQVTNRPLKDPGLLTGGRPQADLLEVSRPGGGGYDDGPPVLRVYVKSEAGGLVIIQEK